MRFFGLGWHHIVGACVLLGAPLAQGATQGRLVVVPSQASMAQAALSDLVKSLAEPLGTKVTVLPTQPYLDAGKTARLGPAMASGTGSAVLLGGQVGASHILFVRAYSETIKVGRKRRSRERLTLIATLVETAHGETLLRRRYTAGPRGFAQADFVGKVVDEVVQALETLPEVAPLARASVQPGAAAQPGASTQVPAAHPAPAAPTRAAEHPAISPAPVIAPSVPQDPYVQALAHSQKPTARDFPKVTAQLGLLIYNRQAVLSTLGTPQLQYGVPLSGRAPVFSRIALSAESYVVRAIRHARPRHLVDGIGVHVGGTFGFPKTRAPAGTAASSLASSLRVGASYAYIVGQRAYSPLFALRLGFTRFSFAMPQNVLFPSLAYNSLYLGLGADVPLATPKVALTAEAALMPALQLGRSGRRLGVHRGGGVGASVDAGVRVRPLPHLDVFALFNWEHYGANFVGSTTLPNATRQYASVSLKDRVVGGRVGVGLSF